MSQLDALFNEYQNLKNRISELEQENTALKSKSQEQEKNLQDRFREIATLTKLLEERDQALSTSASVKAPEVKQSQSVINSSVSKSEEDVFGIIEKSGLFDKDWYLKEYGDVAQSGMNPVEHYVLFGAKELRNPSASFNTSAYLQKNPNVARANVNPLLHYVQSKQAV